MQEISSVVLEEVILIWKGLEEDLEILTLGLALEGVVASHSRSVIDCHIFLPLCLAAILYRERCITRVGIGCFFSVAISPSSLIGCDMIFELGIDFGAWAGGCTSELNSGFLRWKTTDCPHCHRLRNRWTSGVIQWFSDILTSLIRKVMTFWYTSNWHSKIARIPCFRNPKSERSACMADELWGSKYSPGHGWNSDGGRKNWILNGADLKFKLPDDLTNQ